MRESMRSHGFFRLSCMRYVLFKTVNTIIRNNLLYIMLALPYGTVSLLLAGHKQLLAQTSLRNARITKH
ncbi:MAG: hypothetical protein IH595_10390 [Bacteroidales bacterium]|nr:hypothetical protein [Bacteroidales bacterium]